MTLKCGQFDLCPQPHLRRKFGKIPASNSYDIVRTNFITEVRMDQKREDWRHNAFGD